MWFISSVTLDTFPCSSFRPASRVDAVHEVYDRTVRLCRVTKTCIRSFIRTCCGMQSRWQPSYCTMLYLLSLWNKVELSQWSHSPERYFYHVNRASKALYPKYGRFSYGLVANRLKGKGEPHNTFTSEGLTLWFSRITHIDNVIYNSFTLLSTSEFTSLKIHLILSASFEFFSSVIKEYRNKTSECNLVKSAPPVSSEAMLAMQVALGML